MCELPAERQHDTTRLTGRVSPVRATSVQHGCNPPGPQAYPSVYVYVYTYTPVQEYTLWLLVAGCGCATWVMLIVSPPGTDSSTFYVRSCVVSIMLLLCEHTYQVMHKHGVWYMPSYPPYRVGRHAPRAYYAGSAWGTVARGNARVGLAL